MSATQFWSGLSAPPSPLTDELKYDAHVLLVNHGKACPACAKAGSAKHRSAAGGGGVACPLADLKLPPSKLKAASPAGKQQRQGKGSGKAGKKAAAAAAEGGAKAASPARKRKRVEVKVEAVEVEVKEEAVGM